MEYSISMESFIQACDDLLCDNDIAQEGVGTATGQFFVRIWESIKYFCGKLGEAVSKVITKLQTSGFKAGDTVYLPTEAHTLWKNTVKEINPATNQKFFIDNYLKFMTVEDWGDDDAEYHVAYDEDALKVIRDKSSNYAKLMIYKLPENVADIATNTMKYGSILDEIKNYQAILKAEKYKNLTANWKSKQPTAKALKATNRTNAVFIKLVNAGLRATVKCAVLAKATTKKLNKAK